MPNHFARLLSGAALGLALLAVTPACSGPAASGGDTAAKEKADEPPPPPPKRSYDNPNVPITDDELTELDGFCNAVLDCRKRRCDYDAWKTRCKGVGVKTTWGKALQKHCKSSELAGFGRRLAKLVDREHLDRQFRSCREVSARFD